MRVALIADIHGNAYALAAALSAARRHAVNRILCCGDLVGYYYEPDKCLDLLAEWDVECVRGNHEDMLSQLIKRPSLAEGFRRRYGSGLSVAAKVLTPHHLEYLAALPSQQTIAIDGKTVLLCHGAPWDANHYVYPYAGEDVFRRCAESGADYVVAGHTHYRLARRSGSTLVINPGSLGQPRDRTPGAVWVVLDTDTGEYQQRTEPYDAAPLVARAQQTDPHLPYLWEVLARS